MAQPSALDDLLHRVNNLLAVIQTQAEVVRLTGSAEAAGSALRLIEDAARRTGQEMQRYRSSRSNDAGR